MGLDQNELSQNSNRVQNRNASVGLMAMRNNTQYLTREDKENILSQMKKSNLPFAQPLVQEMIETQQKLELKRDASQVKTEELKATFENRNLVKHVYLSNELESQSITPGQVGSNYLSNFNKGQVDSNVVQQSKALSK